MSGGGEERRERKFSSESASENPFRDGGKLSRDAQDIVDAVKTGKLSVISSRELKSDSDEELIGKNSLDRDDTESLVKPIIRKNAVIHNSPKEVDPQPGKVKRDKKCCTIL